MFSTMVSPLDVRRAGIAAIVATALAYRGLKKQSLSRSGAAAAMAVGFLSCAGSYRWGCALIAFYYSSSKLTKLKAEVKAKYEEGVKAGEGQRDYIQVFSCSLVGIVIGVAHVVLYGLGNDHPIDFVSKPLSSKLLCAYMAHFAACNGDTWASEIGILAPSNSTTLITTGRKCPPGTNGGVSRRGTLAATAGGAFIGLVFLLTGGLEGGLFLKTQWPLIPLGAVCGLLGSTIDSIMGATLQASYQHKKTRRVCGHGLGNRDPQEYTLVCGTDVLTNEQVNVLSVTLASVAGAVLGPPVWTLCGW
eukprot:m.1237350 g.1237350  ORF g.1237350 m.1237350 type:complete len:304 (+) comp24668_c0_seq30:155-1066(+)